MCSVLCNCNRLYHCTYYYYFLLFFKPRYIMTALTGLDFFYPTPFSDDLANSNKDGVKLRREFDSFGIARV